MFDFPNSPTIGQQVIEPNGAAVQWDGTKWASVAGQVNSVAPLYNNIGRNLIHNSMFNIQQRGSGPWTTSNSNTADRWIMAFTGGSLSVQIANQNDAGRSQIGDETATYVLACNFTGGSAASDETFVEQHFENIRRLAGKIITLSFWAAASSGSPKLGTMFYQYFGTGGSPSAIVVIPGQSVTLSSTTYVRYSLTFAIPSVSGKTFGTNAGTEYFCVRFALSSSSINNANYGNIGVQSGNVFLWGIQLEIGSTMTQLEKIEYADDLRHCQRFFERRTLAPSEGLGIGTTQSDFNPPTAYFVALPFKVVKRVAATITTSGNSSFAVAGIAVTNISAGGSVNGAWMHFATGSGNTNAAWTAVYVTGSVGGGGFIDASADL